MSHIHHRAYRSTDGRLPRPAQGLPPYPVAVSTRHTSPPDLLMNVRTHNELVGKVHVIKTIYDPACGSGGCYPPRTTTSDEDGP